MSFRVQDVASLLFFFDALAAVRFAAPGVRVFAVGFRVGALRDGRACSGEACFGW